MSSRVPAVGVEFRDAGSEGVVYDTRSRRIHILNSTASVVFKMCQTGARPHEIGDRLRGDFDVPAARVEADVAQILDEFDALGLLNSAPTPTPEVKSEAVAPGEAK
jgi:PqqD family protein of HPr-rel-A system